MAGYHRAERRRRAPLASARDDPQPAAYWVKSSLSFANGNCLEVCELPGGRVGVRNSRRPDGAVLSFTPDEWRAFIGAPGFGGVKDGEFDRFGER